MCPTKGGACSAGKLVVEVDDVLLPAVRVWYAHVADAVADEVSRCFRHFRVRSRVYHIAVCPQAFIVC
eukprot:1585342-Pleurochrysis_carterae.AAC.2